MKKLALTSSIVLAFALTGTANASVSVSAVAGTNPYSGPTPTYTFDSVPGTPAYSGGQVVTGSGTTSAQPFGSTGNYYTVGPSAGSPGTIFFATPGIGVISFIWGSIDDYNTLSFTDALGNPLGAGYTFTGSEIAALIPALANGDRSSMNTNPLVTFTFTGPDFNVVGGMQLSSTRNAFEIDDIAVRGVPEPATWAMMLVGFGALGFAMRRRRPITPAQFA